MCNFNKIVNFFKNKKEDKSIKFIEITTNIGCKNRCAYCPQDVLLKAYFKNNNKRHSSMTFEDFKKLISNVSKEYIINFGGFSEAFSNNECLKMILYAYDLGYQIRINTTLRDISLAELKTLESIDFNCFYVHVPDKDNILKLEINDEYLEKVHLVKTFKNAEFLVIGRVDERIESILNGKIYKSKIYLRGNNLNINDIPKEVELESLNKIDIDMNTKIYCSRANKNINKNQLTWPVVLPDGSMYLCCMDWGLKHYIGNIYLENIDKILNNKTIKEIKKSLICKNNLSIICRECEKAIKYK